MTLVTAGRRRAGKHPGIAPAAGVGPRARPRCAWQDAAAAVLVLVVCSQLAIILAASWPIMTDHPRRPAAVAAAPAPAKATLATSMDSRDVRTWQLLQRDFWPKDVRWVAPPQLAGDAAAQKAVTASGAGQLSSMLTLSGAAAAADAAAGNSAPAAQVEPVSAPARRDAVSAQLLAAAVTPHPTDQTAKAEWAAWVAKLPFEYANAALHQAIRIGTGSLDVRGLPADRLNFEGAYTRWHRPQLANGRPHYRKGPEGPYLFYSVKGSWRLGPVFNPGATGWFAASTHDAGGHEDFLLKEKAGSPAGEVPTGESTWWVNSGAWKKFQLTVLEVPVIPTSESG